MEYVRDHGTFDDFPEDAMMAAWREAYPHFFGEAKAAPTGDFEAEAFEDKRGG